VGTIKWINHNGGTIIEEADKPPKLDRVQEFVDGWVEFVKVLDRDDKARWMLVNDEGLIRDMPINPEASLLYARNSLKRFGKFPTTPIAGNAVLLVDLEYE
jgi:hypothetical protein